jgi:BASS family bile acid:Na+ symporter
MFQNYAQYEYTFAQLQLVLFMLGMGATLSAGDFLEVVRRPRSLLAGAAAQFLLTPLLAVLMNLLFGVGAGIAVGLVLVAAMPGGTLSKLFAYLGKGNLALSVSLTACGTLAAVVTVPLLLRVLLHEFVPAGFHMPAGSIVHDVALYLLLPLLAGMAVARGAPDYSQIFSRWCVRIGFLFVIAMVVGSLGSGRIHPAEYGWRTPVAIILFCLLSQQLSMLPFRLLGWPRADTLSVGIEVTMRNLNLALLLKALLFPAAEKGVDPVADGVLFVILFYAAVAFFAGLPLSLNFRRLARRDACRAEQAAQARAVEAPAPV